MESSALSGLLGRLKDNFVPEKAPDPSDWEPRPTRTNPPAPCIIGERAPFWYEREGIYEEPVYPEPEPERQGLFSRLRARRGR